MKFISLTAVFIFLMSNSCATVPKPGIDSSGEFYYQGVPSYSGAVAWSKDSAQLAVIKGRSLIIIDTESGSSEKINGIHPLFLEWSPGNELLVINKRGNNNELVKINPRDESHRVISVIHSPSAARWFNPPEEIVVLSFNKRIFKIGTFVTYIFSKINASKEKEFFKREVYYPVVNPDIDITSGWTHPGIRPIHESVLTPIYHDPPVIAPYTNFSTVDPVTALESGIIKFNGRRYSVPSSWSPDGSRLAVTDDEGHLNIIDVSNPEVSKPVNYDIKGLSPAWNPMGSQIYLGGWILNSDGPALKQLLPDAFDSTATWSPDGKKVAIVSHEKVLYVKHVSPSFITGDRNVDSALLKVRDKLRTLKDLYVSSLISIDEYNKSKNEILSASERSGP
jgi:hypothetical protein